MNCFIGPNQCSIRYTAFDTVVEIIVTFGPSSELGKIDIKIPFVCCAYIKGSLGCSVLILEMNFTLISVNQWVVLYHVLYLRRLQNFYNRWFK